MEPLIAVVASGNSAHSKARSGRGYRVDQAITITGNEMKTLTTMFAMVLIAFTARASEEIPYVAMPIGIGYAVDVKGARHPNAFCLHDAVRAPHPHYPYQASTRDPLTWTRDLKGGGLYRLNIDLKTGKVSQVTVIKSTGSKILDAAITDAFKVWVFRPGKWKEITIPTAVRKKWVGMTAY
jgi:TonB family protein